MSFAFLREICYTAGYGGEKMPLPQDDAILVSILNMTMRDTGDCLEEACASLGWEIEDVLQRLQKAGYEYEALLKKLR